MRTRTLAPLLAAAVSIPLATAGGVGVKFKAGPLTIPEALRGPACT